MFLVVNATVVDIIVFGMLPLSVIAPFAGLTIVFSLLIASTGCIGSKESLEPIDTLYVGLVLAGVTIVSLFGPHNTGEGVPSRQILYHFRSPVFVVFATLDLLIVAAWTAIYCLPSLHKFKPSGRGRGMLASTVLSAYAAATCGAMSQLFLKIVATAMSEAVATDGLGPFESWQVDSKINSKSAHMYPVLHQTA